MRIFRRLSVVAMVMVAIATMVSSVAIREDAGGRVGATQEIDIIEGVVVGENGPIAGAVIRLIGPGTTTRTDENGRYRFAIHSTPVQSITISQQGYFIKRLKTREARGKIQLQPLPVQDNASYAWVDPAPNAAGDHNCGNCHQELYQQWLTSAHSRSATNLHLKNLFDGTDAYGRENQGWNFLADEPYGGSVCTSCHAPTVKLASQGMHDLRAVDGIAAKGVHCDYCHKIVDSAGIPGLTHGRFGYSLLRPQTGQLFLGGRHDAVGDGNSFSDFYRQSRYCASCHEGVLFGTHVYSTFSEWKASPAARAGESCQSCHMTGSPKFSNLATGHGGLDRSPSKLAGHSFMPGGHSAMLRSCLDVNVETTRIADAIEAKVTVMATDVGHRVPTGFVDHHLILLIHATDDGHESVEMTAGPRLPACVGTLGNSPGMLFAKLLSDPSTSEVLPFWRANDLPVDTRLEPDEPVTSTFIFPKTASQIRVQLLYRHFWEQVARCKGWSDNEITVYERSFAL